ncbi:probable inactive receptor kinase At1g48480 [Rhodamnia argentea]|uniref:Probable inactive receptor kinase At1g48480 n=1 Tax=Rhodamnia argentea TaxID=178133 RepID=A0ABM3HBU5_9MYRT|nr:probable inactive receptor kinase At1g48480 [Rhodamnia argentea]
MNNLWRRIGKRKSSSSKSSSDKNATQNKLVLLGNPAKRFDWEDVKRANWEVLGEGTVGTTYKVDLEDGTTTVVVKRLKDVVLSAEDFQDAVEALGAMDHENLLPLRGYYYSKDQKLLLYDYMPLGSLSDRLHFEYDEWRRPSLSWEVRLSIALGAARAIEHLHAQRRPNDHHGNIKSSNVLLTPSYEARVSDCGLALLARSSQSGGAHPLLADVYGFGVFLLELLTGKRHTLPRLWEEGVDLPAWVQSVAREEGTAQVLDAELTELWDVAMRCVSSNPHRRPWMSIIRKKIEELCSHVGQQGGDSQSDKVSEGTDCESPSSLLIPSPDEDRDSQLGQFSELNNDMYTR